MKTIDKSFTERLTFDTISTQSSEFELVLRLRETAYGKKKAGQIEEIDRYSNHFVCRYEDRLIGALRVTCRKDGPLESESNYPSWILKTYKDQLCACSRLCVDPKFQGGNRIPMPLIRYGWKPILQKGIRLDVSKARIDAVPYYMRMGYYVINDSFFEFDKWNKVCVFVAYPSNAHRKTPISDVFQGIENPINLDNHEHRERFSTCYRSFRSTVKAKFNNN